MTTIQPIVPWLNSNTRKARVAFFHFGARPVGESVPPAAGGLDPFHTKLLFPGALTTDFYARFDSKKVTMAESTFRVMRFHEIALPEPFSRKMKDGGYVAFTWDPAASLGIRFADCRLAELARGILSTPSRGNF